MFKELIISISFLFILSGILGCFAILSKSSISLESQTEQIILEANENN